MFIDSPLGLKITKIYTDLENFWDDEAKALKAAGEHPQDFKNLYSVEKHRDHKQLMEMKGPAIIIAGSGMCTGGRIVDHLEQGLEDPRNDLFCGSSGNRVLLGTALNLGGLHGRQVLSLNHFFRFEISPLTQCRRVILKWEK